MKSVNLEFVFLPVDNDGCDLLVHEDEDGGEESRRDGSYGTPPRVSAERRDDPGPVRICGLKLNIQLFF